MLSPGAIVAAFCEAVSRKNIAAARTFLDDHLVFVGLFETYTNADSYIAALTSLLSITKRYDVNKIVAEGEFAAVFFELETTEPAPAITLVAELHHVRNGKIMHVRSAFDGRPFAAMFGAA